MADDKKSLGVHLRIPIEAVGSFMVWLGDRAPDWGFQIIEAINPNTAQPKAADQLARGRKMAAQTRGRARPQLSTSQIAQKLFDKADGGIVTLGMVAGAFEENGFSRKSAQTLLDRWRASGKIERPEPGKYRWIAKAS